MANDAFSSLLQPLTPLPPSTAGDLPVGGDGTWAGPTLGSLFGSQRAASEARTKSINVVEHSVAKLSQQVRVAESCCCCCFLGRR